MVVSTAADVDLALGLALGARDRDIDVDVFVMDEAVAAVASRREQVERLVDAGCELCACAHSASERGLADTDLGMTLGSQDDHAAIASRADRLVAFT